MIPVVTRPADRAPGGVLWPEHQPDQAQTSEGPRGSAGAGSGAHRVLALRAALTARRSETVVCPSPASCQEPQCQHRAGLAYIPHSHLSARPQRRRRKAEKKLCSI